MAGAADRHPSICLCMIVKNETKVLARCLASCRELIDYWVICDTGSTDGTQELIRHELAGTPGELHEHEWVDFGHNRSELMKLARGKADYLLLIDADMTVVQEQALPKLRADSYMLRQGGDYFDYRNKRLVSGDLGWRYVGATHEYITCIDTERVVENLDAIVIHDYGDGGSKADKFERDAALLEAALRDHPEDARAVFYLAQTYRDMGQVGGDPDKLAASLELYERRAQMGGWDEEIFYSLYQVGVLRDQLGDWPEAVVALMSAWQFRPQRLEPVYHLATELRVREQYHPAHQFARLAEGLDPLPVPRDILFVAPAVYRWGLLFEYSITAYWTGELRKALGAYDRLLALDDLPPLYREQTQENRVKCLAALARTAPAPRPPRKVPAASSSTGRARPASG